MQAALAALAGEQDRWILWAPVILGIGIGLYFAVPVEPPLWLGTACILAAIVAGWLKRARGKILLLATAFGLLALGFSVAQWRTVLVTAPALERQIGPTGVTGRVVGMETLPKGSRIRLDKVHIAGLDPHRTPKRVRIILKGPQPALQPGDRITLRAQLVPPPPPAAPGAFDFQRRAFFDGLGGVGWALGPAEITDRRATQGLDSILLGLAELRHNVTRRIHAALPGERGTVAAALMTGERRTVAPDLMEAIRDSGLAHLLAISGLHIGLVAGVLFVGVRAALALVPPLALRYPIKKWAAAAAIPGAFAYALLAGATIPTLRAFLMIGLVLLAVLVDRRGISMRLVAWAALVILLIRPESILGASFQMSFAAVIALVAVFEALRGHFGGRGKRGPLRIIALYLAGVAVTTLIAGTATAPFAIYHFNRFAAFGLAANMAAVPVTALWVMPWIVIAFLLMPLGLESWALVPMSWGIDVVLYVARTVASWPGAVTVLPAMSTSLLALVSLSGLWLCLWRMPWRRLGAVGIVAGFAVFPWTAPPDLLVDGKARVVAARTPDGHLAVSSLRSARFERDVWLRRAGTARMEPWPENTEEAGTGGWLSCDSLGCIYKARGRTVAVVRKPGALLEDCPRVDALISLVPIRQPCPGPGVVVDRFDLWQEGTHALWIGTNGRIRVESVNNSRGRRPWVLRPRASGF